MQFPEGLENTTFTIPRAFVKLDNIDVRVPPLNFW